ncbi:MAG: sporulation protein YabP [Lachnospiraceae bacterium]|nr:sporulation protein YabP [Lachnospiraceae bacterium]MDE6760611.1 sporulation protein YabP [Lachnospiraceae bacterium]
MEEVRNMKTHKITLNNRGAGVITGVNAVISFDLNEILLETEQGMLLIKGTDLNVTKLTLEKGEVEVDGRVDSFTYSDLKPGLKAENGFFDRLFK